MALNTIGALGRVSYANRYKFLYFPRKGLSFSKISLLKISESLEHVLLDILQVFVMLPTVKGVKVFAHLSLLS